MAWGWWYEWCENWGICIVGTPPPFPNNQERSETYVKVGFLKTRENRDEPK